jgi:hypothetical protein
VLGREQLQMVLEIAASRELALSVLPRDTAKRPVST